MKLLCFTDFHASKKCLDSIRKKASKADLLVCTGDVSIFEHGLPEVLEELDTMGKPVILIHGNHEDEDTLRTLCEDLDNVHFIHMGVLIYENVAFVGYGGGGFASTDKFFDKAMKKMLKEVPKGKKTVLMLHQPPHGLNMDIVYGDEHVGNKSFTKFLEANQKFHLVLCGHIHEGFRKKDRIGETVVLNPGNMGLYVEIK